MAKVISRLSPVRFFLHDFLPTEYLIEIFPDYARHLLMVCGAGYELIFSYGKVIEQVKVHLISTKEEEKNLICLLNLINRDKLHLCAENISLYIFPPFLSHFSVHFNICWSFPKSWIRSAYETTIVTEKVLTTFEEVTVGWI